MCGIAGYNCSPEAAAEFGADRFGNILTGIWERNVHRGTDAHGYMLGRLKTVESELEFDVVEAWKDRGSAYDSIHAETYPRGIKPVNLGVHTRLATTGSEFNNDNNHPVNAGDVWVTHNGMIDPVHHYLKDGKRHPEVDSYYIAYVLNSIAGNDVTEFDSFKEVLDLLEEEIQGGYAFHAMWESIPGLSLLVKGDMNPLVTAYNEDRGVMLYASEKDAVAYMMEKFNLPKKGTTIGSAPDGTVVLMYLGEVIHYGEYKPKSRWGNNVSYGYSRHKKDLWRVTPDYEFIADLSLDPDFDSYIPKSAKELEEWQQKQTYVYPHEELPAFFYGSEKVRNRLEIWGGHFDEVFVYCPTHCKTVTSSSIRYFCFSEDDEFIFNEDFELLDVIPWDEYLDASPWIEVDQAGSAKAFTGEFRDWWVDRISVYESIEDTWHAPEKVSVDPKAVLDLEASEFDDRRLNLLNYENNRNTLIRHMRDYMIVTVGDPTCSQHNQRFSTHTRPWDCSVLSNCAKMVLASARTVSDLVAIYDIKVQTVGGHDACNHVWKNVQMREVEINPDMEGEKYLTYLHPDTDLCTKCERKISISQALNTFKDFYKRSPVKTGVIVKA